MGGCLLAVNKRNDVWMMEPFQDVDLGVQVFFKFLVELLEVDRFDGYIAASLLFREIAVSIDSIAGIPHIISTMEIGRNHCSSICNDAQVDTTSSITTQSKFLLTTCIAL